MKTIPAVIHIIISVLFIVLILLQSQGSGLSSAFGGGGGSYYSKRGMEKVVFTATIILGICFFITSLINFLTF